MGDEVWVMPAKAAAAFGVSVQTLRNWSNDGWIEHKETLKGHRRYPLPVQGAAAKGEERHGIAYARVSSSKQRPDLQRQIAFLRERFPGHKVISDVGGGVNFARPGLRSVLDACMRGTVSEVVVAHRDRLARIGSGLIEHIIQRCGSVLTVVEDRSCDGCPEELANDVLEVLTHFTAKHNGRRAYRQRESSTPSGQ